MRGAGRELHEFAYAQLVFDTLNDRTNLRWSLEVFHTVGDLQAPQSPIAG